MKLQRPLRRGEKLICVLFVAVIGSLLVVWLGAKP